MGKYSCPRVSTVPTGPPVQTRKINATDRNRFFCVHFILTIFLHINTCYVAYNIDASGDIILVSTILSDFTVLRVYRL